jgi:hypothetical protein
MRTAHDRCNHPVITQSEPELVGQTVETDPLPTVRGSTPAAISSVAE